MGDEPVEHVGVLEVARVPYLLVDALGAALSSQPMELHDLALHRTRTHTPPHTHHRTRVISPQAGHGVERVRERVDT